MKALVDQCNRGQKLQSVFVGHHLLKYHQWLEIVLFWKLLRIKLDFQSIQKPGGDEIWLFGYIFRIINQIQDQ